MSTTLRLTPWYPARIKPVRKGWYEVSSGKLHHRNKAFLTGRLRFWDGNTWRAGWSCGLQSIFGTHPEHQWRGVLK